MQNSYDKLYPNYRKIVNSRNLRKIIKVSLVLVIIFVSGFVGGFLAQKTIQEAKLQIVEVPLPVEIPVETKQFWIDQDLDILNIQYDAIVLKEKEYNFNPELQFQIQKQIKNSVGDSIVFMDGSNRWDFDDFISSIPISLFDDTLETLDFQSSFIAIRFTENTVQIQLSEYQEDYYFVYSLQDGLLHSLIADLYQNSPLNLNRVSLNFVGVESR